MKIVNIIPKANKKLKVIFNKKSKREIITYKKEIWQTDDVSQSFVKGTDEKNVLSAHLLNLEVNKYFLANCKPNDRVLDIGCGHGIVSEYLAENGISTTSVDISNKLLEEFRKRIQNKNLPVTIKQGDAYNLPFFDNEFDVVVARMFLPHFPDWPVVLKEIARVTKKGGRLLIHFASKENTVIGGKIGKMNCRFASDTNYFNPGTYYAETDDKELNKVCKKIGLKVLKRTPVSFFMQNRIFGFQLGTEKHNNYMHKLEEYLKNENIRNFVIWFGKEVIENCSPALSHSNIIIFLKV